MDNLVYEESINTEVDNSEFVSKKWIYANDNNSQNYSSQVILDTTALSNSGSYIMWAEAFIIMPLVVCLSAYRNDNNNAVNMDTAQYIDQSWAFKSGFMNMVHSATIEYNNSNVCQQTPLVNVFKNFEILTSWSLDNLKNDAPSTGYYPDKADTFGVSKAQAQKAYSGLQGTDPQLFNNCIGVFQTASNTSTNLSATSPLAIATLTYGASGTPATATFAPATTITNIPANSITFSGVSTLDSPYINNGLAFRNVQSSISLNASSTGASLGQDSIYSNTTLQTNWINQRVLGTSAGSAQWFIYAKLYLKNFADLFDKTPLLKGSTLRFYINTNQCLSEFQVNTGTSDGTPASSPFIVNASTTITNNGGSTNPLMITNVMPLAIRKALGVDSIVVNCKLSVSIYQNRWAQQANAPAGGAISWGSSPLQSCRLYAPAYKFTSLAEQKYLSLTPTKTIEYSDVFQYQFQNISGTSDFNILVSNGLQGIQSVLVVPFLQNDSANGTIQKTSYSTLLSPYTSSGSTPDPIPLTNFNILVSGVNLFLDNEQYDFQQFLEELKSSNQLNGNLTNGLTSGLINENDFSQLYRYYYGNCKRVLPAEEDVSRSIQIRGKVNLPSNQNIVLMVFVKFKRKITIDIQTGARID